MNPKLIKPAIVGGGALLVLLILFFIFRKLFMARPGKETLNDVEKQRNEKFSSYQPQVYSGWAERLYKAMQGYGTSESTIYDILGNLKNKYDWFELVTAFGLKTYEGEKLGLLGWLESELDSMELNTVKKYLQNIKVTL
jgi:hypothetical protein